MFLQLIVWGALLAVQDLFQIVAGVLVLPYLDLVLLLPLNELLFPLQVPLSLSFKSVHFLSHSDVLLSQLVHFDIVQLPLAAPFFLFHLNQPIPLCLLHFVWSLGHHHALIILSLQLVEIVLELFGHLQLPDQLWMCLYEFLLEESHLVLVGHQTGGLAQVADWGLLGQWVGVVVGLGTALYRANFGCVHHRE